jgi:hypothetical protein
LNVALPYVSTVPDVNNSYDLVRLMSKSTIVKDVNVRVGADVQATTELDIEFERVSIDEQAAVCIPSHPATVVKLGGDNCTYLLTQWWAEWRHNIAVHYGEVPYVPVGSLFLVLQKRHSEQFSNCYYEGNQTQTKLSLSGQVSSIANFALRAGFSSQEIGSFGFKNGRPQPGETWAIFMDSVKITIVWHKRLMARINLLWQ